MKEAFGIAAANTKRRRDMGKRKRDQKARFQPLEVGGRILVRNLNEKGGPHKTKAFWQQKMYKILEKKMKMVESMQCERKATHMRG